MENDPFDLGSDTPPPPQAQPGSISAAARANMDARRVGPMLDGLNDEQRALFWLKTAHFCCWPEPAPENAGTDHTHCPQNCHGTSVAKPNFGGDLYQ